MKNKKKQKARELERPGILYGLFSFLLNCNDEIKVFSRLYFNVTKNKLTGAFERIFAQRS